MKGIQATKLNLSNRSFVLELKSMREISDDNLNAFKGLCLDDGHQCIFMEYAQRGSLQDLIENIDMRGLAADFKISIATDIARGMNVLHKSAIGTNWYSHSSQ